MEETIIDFKVLAGSLVADPLPGLDIALAGVIQMDNQTQPLHIDGGNFEVKGEGLTYEEIEYLKKRSEIQAQDEMAQQAEKAWQELKTAFKPLAQAFKSIPQPKPVHVHGPFIFLLNQNHNALRGCQSCGATWTGLMSGIQENDLRWHVVPEPVEAEEEE